MRRFLFLASLCGLMAAGIPRVFADDTPEGRIINAGRLIVGTGTATATSTHNLLQFDAQLVAKGGSIKEALDHLRLQRGHFETQFKELLTGEDSLKIGATRRYLPNGAATIRQRDGTPALPEAETEVYVTAPVHAEWTLSGTDADELLLNAEEVESRLRSAKLGWTKSALETAGAPNGFARNRAGRFPIEPGLQPLDGPPLFSQSPGALTAEQRFRMLTEAYQIAHKNAEELARAANRQLGELHTLKRTTPDPRPRAHFHVREPSGTVAVEVTFELLPVQDP